MADTLKVLGQSAPVAITLTDIYTVPASTSASISSIVICNRGSANTTFRIAVAPAGAVDTTAHYQYYDETVPGNKTFVATIGPSLATTDKIRVFAGNANLSFTVFGVEIT